MRVYRRWWSNPSRRGDFAVATTIAKGTVALAIASAVIGCGETSEDATPTITATTAEAPAESEPAETSAEPAPEATASEDAAAVAPEVAVNQPPIPEPLPAPAGAKRLSPDHDIWIDVEAGALIIDGNVSLRRGVLEMFACTRNTKEHESVISANTLAFTAHAALLRLGAETGSPVTYEPEFSPPSGTEIEIELSWQDADGKLQKAPAQQWVRDLRTEKEMTHPWVFAGSWIAENEETGEKAYMAEGGDFICVSNFSTAMLDIPVESTQAQDGLYFEAFTERIPPLGTPVRMTLRPKLDKKAEE